MKEKNEDRVETLAGTVTVVKFVNSKSNRGLWVRLKYKSLRNIDFSPVRLRLRPCLVPKKIDFFFQIPRHIESLDVWIEY